jgi:prepilin-type N-terminal cleavage/methylation domain-containing protein
MIARPQRGTTLIELLIAVTLVSLLALGIVTAMRVGLNAMTKANDKLIANRRIASVERILQAEVEGMMPLRTTCRPTPQAQGPEFEFFEGRHDEMRFVSSYSLQESGRGYPRVLEYRVIPGERGEGVRLIVNELFYTGPASLGQLCSTFAPDPQTGEAVPQMRPVEASPASFVLADRLAYCRIWYHETLPPPELERWTPEWGRGKWPSAIRIEMAPLAPDTSRLQLSTVTLPVRVQKVIGVNYEDQ